MPDRYGEDPTELDTPDDVWAASERRKRSSTATAATTTATGAAGCATTETATRLGAAR